MSESSARQTAPKCLMRRYADSRFKTMRISVNLLVPLARETAAAYGILPGIITHATEKYPDFGALSRRLSELYGAYLDSNVCKVGGFQCLSFSVGGISTRYAFGGENMFEELSQLLRDALSHPLRDGDGLFPKEYFEQEQRQLLELKDSEFNDKITYAQQRCEELLFDGSSAAVDRYGSREDIEGLDRRFLSTAWDKLWASAVQQAFFLGDCPSSPELSQNESSLADKTSALKPLPYQEPAGVRRLTEEQPLSQSKLSMGFRVDSKPEERLLFQLMNTVLGGSTSSKLFQNVREKMSLCYYCASAYSSLSRALYIKSGVETENLEKAEEAILEQLSRLQKGELTEEELSSAKLALCNSYRSVGDSLSSVENWYLSQTFYEKEISPGDAAQKVMSYTAEQVIEAAAKVKPAAVYSLKGSDVG